MSLINDALKEARNAPPPGPTNSFPPLPPAEQPATTPLIWLIPSVVVVLLMVAVFSISWAVVHHSTSTKVAAAKVTVANPVAVTPPVLVVTSTVVAPPLTPPPVKLPEPPKLQGIFYSVSAPSAIIDGKTVQPGDSFRQYRVKEITKNAVVLVDADRKTIQLDMGN